MEQKTQSDKAFNFILNQLKSGSWKPGDKIYTEKELCDRLEISRVIVREAVEKCVALGLLRRRKGDGTYVMDYGIGTVLEAVTPLLTLRPMDLMDVLTFRLYFEVGNVREFVQSCDEQDILLLEQTYRRMKENVDDATEFYMADYDFHDTIARGTKNPLVIEISTMLKDVLINAQETINYTIGTEVGLKYHRDIIHALREKDETLAALMMERHILSTMDNMRGRLSEERYEERQPRYV